MENVLVLKTTDLDLLNKQNPLENILDFTFFTKRQPAETNEELKQIIPYVYISFENSDTFLISKRLKGSTESRLVDKLSLGFGGHINTSDNERSATPADIFDSCIRRELSEELAIPQLWHYSFTFKGMINLNTNAVERCHLGLVYHLSLSTKAITSAEKDKLSTEWINKAEIKQNYEQLEGWSKFVFENYID